MYTLYWYKPMHLLYTKLALLTRVSGLSTLLQCCLRLLPTYLHTYIHKYIHTYIYTEKAWQGPGAKVGCRFQQSFTIPRLLTSLGIGVSIDMIQLSYRPQSAIVPSLRHGANLLGLWVVPRMNKLASQPEKDVCTICCPVKSRLANFS